MKIILSCVFFTFFFVQTVAGQFIYKLPPSDKPAEWVKNCNISMFEDEHLWLYITHNNDTINTLISCDPIYMTAEGKIYSDSNRQKGSFFSLFGLFNKGPNIKLNFQYKDKNDATFYLEIINKSYSQIAITMSIMAEYEITTWIFGGRSKQTLTGPLPNQTLLHVRKN